MAELVMMQIDLAIELFTSLIQYGAKTPRYQRNLQWLIKLRTRAATKVAAASNQVPPKSVQEVDADQPTDGEDRADDEHEELLGLRTRLIERAGHSRPIRRTVGMKTNVPTLSTQRHVDTTTPTYPDVSAMTSTFSTGPGDSVGDLVRTACGFSSIESD